MLTNLESWLVIEANIFKYYLASYINLQVKKLRTDPLVDFPKEQIHFRKIQNMNPEIQTLILPFLKLW